MIRAIKISLAITIAFALVHAGLMKATPAFSMSHIGLAMAVAIAGMILGFVGEPLKLFAVAAS